MFALVCINALPESYVSLVVMYVERGPPRAENNPLTHTTHRPQNISVCLRVCGSTRLFDCDCDCGFDFVLILFDHEYVNVVLCVLCVLCVVGLFSAVGGPR